jgi:hypothetical protein
VGGWPPRYDTLFFREVRTRLAIEMLLKSPGNRDVGNRMNDKNVIIYYYSFEHRHMDMDSLRY